MEKEAIKKKTLFLKSGTDSFEKFYNKEIIKRNCDVFDWDQLYKKGQRGLLKGKNIYKCIHRLYVQGILKQYNRIIVFDDALIIIILFFLIRKECTLELWIWNTLNLKQGIKIFIAKRFCNVWTFDENDAKKYHIKWNTQFYFPVKNNYIKNINVEGIYFIGADKGRFELLRGLTDYCREYGLYYNFNMVREKDKCYQKEYDDILCDHFVEYPIVLSQIKNSKVILDLTKKYQTGMTVRVLEAIYYNKKIITNNKYLINSNFYDSKKIFILGYDSIEKLPSFVHSASVNYDKAIIEYYSFDYWLKRFEDDGD